MQPDSLPTQDTKQPDVIPVQEKPTPKRSTGFVILTVILLLALIGVGFWAYQLNSQLAATQQQLAALQTKYDTLQADHAKLQTDHGKMTTDLNQTKTDLEKANNDLTAAQADLKKSQYQNTGLITKIDAASKKADILYAFTNVASTSDILAIDALIKATKDNELLTQWNSFANSPTEQSSTDLLFYLITAVRDSLK